jgi:hypothetical protein
MISPRTLMWPGDTLYKFCECVDLVVLVRVIVIGFCGCRVFEYRNNDYEYEHRYAEHDT